GKLHTQIFKQIKLEALSEGDVVIDSQRQYELLQRASESLSAVQVSVRNKESLDIIALDLQDALGALGEITGEVSSEDVLDRMFSGFCLGK
ncbi:MAG: tRNA uridine-5-carboxymethylaminomethyl(34) synthesis GTPase MnmE, partial [Spirochaetaceae bacterium]